MMINSLNFSPSRQMEIQPMNRPFPLENGEPSYVEFDTNRNNRYLTNEQAAKNRPVAPSHVLYYFNTPPNMTEIDIVRFFEDVGAKRPVKVKNFPQRKESHRRILRIEISDLIDTRIFFSFIFS